MVEKKKSGRLSRVEWDFIERNAKKMTAEQIANALNKDLGSVKRYMGKIGALNGIAKEGYELQAEYDLRNRMFFKELKKQFTEEELELFLYHWKLIIAQFRRDVLATEELQIIDVIKLEILMNRALNDQKSTMDTISRMEEEIRTMELIPLAERTQDGRQELYMSLQRQVATLRAAKEALSKDYKDLQTKKSGMFKDLKATREQRVQRLESNKTTFAGLVSKLLQDPDFYEEQGRQMEMMRLATEGCRQELSGYHTFSDGAVDRILLNSDSVSLDNE